MADPLDAQLEAADRRGQVRLSCDPRAASARFQHESGRIEIELMNGCAYAFPASLVQDLQGAGKADLAEIMIDGLGFNLHWPKLDVDLYVPALVSGIFGTREWMSRELARVAGRVSSPAKAIAARRNGTKGGRPRKAGTASNPPHPVTRAR